MYEIHQDKDKCSCIIFGYEVTARTKKARMNSVADVHKTYLIPKYPSQSGCKRLIFWI